MIRKLLSIIILVALMQGGISCRKNPQGSLGTPGGWKSAVVEGDGVEEAGESGLNRDEELQMVREHNRVRANVGVGPVAWSPALARHARQWADHLAAGDCQMRHRPKTGEWAGTYGENLFTGTAGYYGVVDAVRAWESEKRIYHGEPISSANFRQVGHYTQMVWRNTGEFGCAKVQCQGRIIIVCNYDPPGNVLGQNPY
jgi:pathogenesis-related protein 1